MRLFISSVQKEFTEERQALHDFLLGDPLLRRFFEPFLFEDVPAADRRADEVYLDEVERCDVYVGLFGYEYGFEDSRGVSPTEHEFDLATRLRKHRLIFVKGNDDKGRHPKIQALIRTAGSQLIRRRFGSNAELVASVYAALVEFLISRELIRYGPFDGASCEKATLDDLDEERMRRFVREARRARGFPLSEEVAKEELLTHLNLLNDGRTTNAAILLFGHQPQRFLLSSEVKCAHFHGTEVAKPIPSYQVYKGTVFELVDQAVDFVMSKINLRVGTRAEGPQAPVEYEIPREVVGEAIVNAVAHRDYTSNGSVQVMLFADRLEIWNPGRLPATLTLEMLRQPHGSVPGNPLLAEPLYLTRYIERMGTGTRDMIRRCREAGLQEPDFSVSDGFVTLIRRKAVEKAGIGLQPESEPESQPESEPESLEVRVLAVLKNGPLSKGQISDQLGQKEISGYLNKLIRLLLSDQTIEYTIPEKPNSRLQKYRLTAKGAALLAPKGKGKP
jgi:ATP-dependent DNA helicase RecG